VRALLLLLPALLFHGFLGAALVTIARRLAVGPAAWAWLPGLNLALLLRVAGRAPAWALLFLIPGVNLAVWAAAWAEAAARVGRSPWLGIVMALPGPNLWALGSLAGLPARVAVALGLAVLATLPVAWTTHTAVLRERVASLARDLGAADAGVRRRAAVDLAALGPRAASARPSLQRAQDDAEAGVRGQAARALWLIGDDGSTPAAGPGVAALLEATRGSLGWPLPDADVVAALAVATREDPRALSSALTDADPGVRWHAAAAFVRLGRRGAAAVPCLLEAMRDPEWNVRNAAGRALEEAAGPEHAELLTAALATPDVETRYHVARALARLGPSAARAVSVLQDTLADADAEVRMEAVWALAAIGPAAASAVPALLRALGDADAQVRAAAAWALAHVGAGRDAALSLEPLSRDPDRDVREAAEAAGRRLAGPQ
jgi:HEAT repeat protein